jgi:acyl-CoA synthetase (AMP-forming)/AMP-acid ligase II
MMDISGWTTRLCPETVARFTQSGVWANQTLRDCAEQWARSSPDKAVVVNGDRQLTFAQLYEQALHLASALRARGLRQGDVISFQLPNWSETLVINLAACIGGWVCNPIVPIYRDAEVRFILKDAQSKVLFIPTSYRSIDYEQMVGRLRAELPQLKEVFVVRASSTGLPRYEDLLSERAATPESFPAVDANAVKLLMYTSGTTGEPKGVLHSHNTLRADIDANIRFRSLTPADVLLMASPVTHITGYLYALELPFAAGITALLMDRWNAVEGCDLIERHGVTFSSGATPFLAELVGVAEQTGRSLPSMRLYGSGGAPVPPDLVRRARKAMPNCQTYRAYGCSEAPTISLGLAQGDPVELAATTDGRVVNHEVRIVDAETGAALDGGQEGEILTRGPEVMLGYTNPEHTKAAFDAEGFFRTGDLGRLDSRGYITISGRKKDIIIRGGENLSAKEIEDVLHQHPSVLEAAVVAMPHPRMGETPCAFVTLRPGSSLDFDVMKAFLDQAQLARQKIPERLEILAQLPRNAAGKVLKHELKARVAEALRAPQDRLCIPSA